MIQGGGHHHTYERREVLERTGNRSNSCIRSALQIWTCGSRCHKTDLDQPGNASSHEGPAKYAMDLDTIEPSKRSWTVHVSEIAHLFGECKGLSVRRHCPPGHDDASSNDKADRRWRLKWTHIREGTTLRLLFRESKIPRMPPAHPGKPLVQYPLVSQTLSTYTRYQERCAVDPCGTRSLHDAP